jgi:hypothetical protein
VLGLITSATAARSLPWLGLPRLSERRVDRRDGRSAASSSTTLIRLPGAREFRRAE